jgi:hypothetical protein
MSKQIVPAVPHKHAEVIKQWADGAAIQYRNIGGSTWFDIGEDGPRWNLNWEYRVKPVMSYPVTQMSGDALRDYYYTYRGGPVSEAMIRVANAALRHACDAGQIITMVDHQVALITLGENLRDVEIARHTARDMAIAEAVRKFCENKAANDSTKYAAYKAIQDADLEAIIAKATGSAA